MCTYVRVWLNYLYVLSRSTVVAVKFQSRPLVSLARSLVAPINNRGGEVFYCVRGKPRTPIYGILRIGIHVAQHVVRLVYFLHVRVKL